MHLRTLSNQELSLYTPGLLLLSEEMAASMEADIKKLRMARRGAEVGVPARLHDLGVTA